MPDFLQDFRVAVRVLWHRPGFTAVAVLTLALAIAANSTVFIWINSVILQPVPGVAAPDRLAAIEEIASTGEHTACAHPDFRDFQQRSTLLSGVTAAHFTPFTVGEPDSAQRVYGQMVSANFFAVLGVKPELGRLFTPQEDNDARGAFPLAVISDRLWRAHFQADPRIIGKAARFNGRELTVIGVAPPEFRGTMGGLHLDVWVPLTMILDMGGLNTWAAADRNARFLDVLVRLKPGVTLGRASAEIQSIAADIARRYPDTHSGVSAAVIPLARAQFGVQSILGNPLRILMAVCVLVLLIACANVANLMLARSITRRQEFGIRLAMGGSRVRLLRQVMAEVLTISAAGALVGIWLVQWTSTALTYLLPNTNLPVGDTLAFIQAAASARVLAFTVAVSIAAALLSAVLPIVYTGRVELNEAVKQGGRSTTHSAASLRARSLLVGVEVALALVALVGAGLFLRSFRNARNLNPGFDSHNVLIARLYLSASGYTRDQEKLFDRKLRDRMAAAPGVEEVSYADWVPLWFGDPPWENIEIEGAATGPNRLFKTFRTQVAPGYFRLLRIPLIAGRDFTAQDDAKSARVIIVNQAFLRRFLPVGDPLGRKVRVAGTVSTVVGVVRDSKQSNPAQAPYPYFFVPFQQRFGRGHNNFLYIRTNGSPDTVRAALHREIAALDPAAGLYDAMPLTEYTEASLYQHKVAASLLSALGILSLLLAAVGLYSVMSYSVSERTREIGIRMALGAQPRNVLALVLRQGLVMTLSGLLAGIVIALAGARLVAALLIGVGGADPLTYAAASLFLCAIALFATWIPARRATRVDPMTSLRCQ